MFRLGYNTNGLAHHRPLDALELLADIGYESVAVTPDVGPLDPYNLDKHVVAEMRERADELGLELAIETGARFLLDPANKHFPTLLEDSQTARARRVDFLKRCISLACELDAGLVSLWSGQAPSGVVAGDGSGADAERMWDRLCEGLQTVLDFGAGAQVRVAFEPEPGMFIERPSEYRSLTQRLGDAGDGLGLCLDVGHLLVTGDLPVGRVIRAFAADLVHVHLDDIRGGVHEHRMFGEGDLDLKDTVNALLDVGYDGMAAIELSRDSHRGAQAAREAFQHLTRALA